MIWVFAALSSLYLSVACFAAILRLSWLSQVYSHSHLPWCWPVITFRPPHSSVPLLYPSLPYLSFPRRQLLFPHRLFLSSLHRSFFLLQQLYSSHSFYLLRPHSFPHHL